MEHATKWLMLVLIIAEVILVRAGLLDVATAVVVVVGIEALLFVVAGRQIVIAVRRYRRDRVTGLDLWTSLEDGLSSLLPRPLARVVALEPKLWACLGKWVLRRNRPGQREYHYHKRSPVGSLLLVVLFTAPVEVLLFELLVPWAWLRWLLLIGAIYMLFWAFGFYASLLMLPHRLGPAGITLRYGAVAEGSIPYSEIARVERERRQPLGRGDGLSVQRTESAAYLAVGGQTDVTLHLRTPRALCGLLGPTVPVTTVHLAVDDPTGLVRELDEAIAGHTGVAYDPARGRSC